MTGLAPEIPEDLYMLIKKVRNLNGLMYPCADPQRLWPSESTSSAIEKTKTPNSASFL